MQRPDGGRVQLRRARPRSDCRSHRRARLGLARTFQRIELFGGLTVRDHLLVGRPGPPRRGRGIVARPHGRARGPTPTSGERCDDVLELLGLSADADRPIESLSLGRGRLVELGRALVSRARSCCSSTSRRRASTATRPTRWPTCCATVQARAAAPPSCWSSTTSPMVAAPDHPRRTCSTPAADRRGRRPTRCSPTPRCARPTWEPRRDARRPTRPSAPSARRRCSSSSDVDAGYGPFRALFGVSFTIAPRPRPSPCSAPTAPARPRWPGSPRVWSAPTAGAVLVDGDDVTGQPAHALRPRRASPTPPRAARCSPRSPSRRTSRSRSARRSAGPACRPASTAYELFPRLGERRRQLAGSLSGGEQRMLTWPGCSCSSRRLLIADELSLGLAPDHHRRGVRQRSAASATRARRC